MNVISTLASETKRNKLFFLWLKVYTFLPTRVELSLNQVNKVLIHSEYLCFSWRNIQINTQIRAVNFLKDPRVRFAVQISSLDVVLSCYLLQAINKIAENNDTSVNLCEYYTGNHWHAYTIFSTEQHLMA